jgi:hypothetical protein
MTVKLATEDGCKTLPSSPAGKSIAEGLNIQRKHMKISDLGQTRKHRGGPESVRLGKTL